MFGIYSGDKRPKLKLSGTPLKFTKSSHYLILKENTLLWVFIHGRHPLKLTPVGVEKGNPSMASRTFRLIRLKKHTNAAPTAGMNLVNKVAVNAYRTGFIPTKNWVDMMIPVSSRWEVRAVQIKKRLLLIASLWTIEIYGIAMPPSTRIICPVTWRE